MKKLKKILIFFVFLYLFLFFCYIASVIALHKMVNDIYRYFDLIRYDMTVAEIRQLLSDSFNECNVSIDAVESEGYTLDRYFSDKKKIYAMKYEYWLWNDLYIYLIFDENDTLKLKIDATP